MENLSAIVVKVDYIIGSQMVVEEQSVWFYRLLGRCRSIGSLTTLSPSTKPKITEDAYILVYILREVFPISVKEDTTTLQLGLNLKSELVGLKKRVRDQKF